MTLLRYDTKVYFWGETKRIYNPITHKSENEISSKEVRFANVTDLGLQKQVQLLGGIKAGSKTVRLQKDDLSNWSYMTFDKEGTGIKYRFVSSLDVLKGFAMIVGKDNG